MTPLFPANPTTYPDSLAVDAYGRPDGESANESLTNDSRAGEGSFSVPLRNYEVGAGRAKANEAPFHGVTAWECGHETRCRCKGGARRNGVGNCPDCRDKANEGGKPCGESFIAADKQCLHGLAGHVAHFDDDAPAEHLAQHVLSVAKAEEPHTTQSLKDAVAKTDGYVKGLDHALKTPESLARKIYDKAEMKGLSRKEYAGRIGDALRYTVVLPEQGYTEGVAKIREHLAGEGIQTRVRGDDNKWNSPDYKGLHLTVKTKNGIAAELQIHTPASIAAKAEAHKIYKEARVEKDPEKKRTMADRMKSIYRLISAPVGAMSILA